MTPEAEAPLKQFDQEHIGLAKGALSVALILTRQVKTRQAQSKKFPIDPAEFETKKAGQVAGLGGPALAKILRDYGIDRVLSSEGGRTSRGSLEKMRAYIALLNELQARGALDLEEVEKWWIERVRLYFESQPFTFKLDAAKSLRACIRELLEQANERQRQARGMMFAGTLMQHLVGAKLEIVSEQKVAHHGAAVADASSNRSSDFLIGDVAIHVTTAPGEPLIKKCASNLSTGLRPMIVTTEDGAAGARAIAKAAGLEDRIDIIEIEQFIAANLYEMSRFKLADRPVAVRELVDRYNTIVDQAETDQSLRIEFEG